MTPLQDKVAQALDRSIWVRTGAVASAADCSSQAALRALSRMEELGRACRRESAYEYGGKKRKTWEWSAI